MLCLLYSMLSNICLFRIYLLLDIMDAEGSKLPSVRMTMDLWSPGLVILGSWGASIGSIWLDLRKTKLTLLWNWMLHNKYSMLLGFLLCKGLGNKGENLLFMELFMISGMVFWRIWELICLQSIIFPNNFR